ncbi:Hypothetical protein GLP15_5069 [Giardia lamblia P15]|uniref:LMBR1-like membrane protein n=1 Tax=Giardia intestinalis (strain P15) TaxID=658858 RepID=E1F7T5_GIAIA|nr:Hypothetical protein GLP15_5069 [Giardia lamblia P15]
MDYSELAILVILFFTAAALTYTGIVFKLFPNSSTINLLDYIIVGTALVFGMTAFLGFPPDIAESSAMTSESSAFSTGPMVGLWKFLYFGWLIFNWAVIFLYKQLLKSGHWNFWGRLGHGMLRTLTIYLLIGIPAIIVVVVLVATRQFTMNVLYTLLISLINTFGTFQIVILLAYGTVDVPRRLIMAAFPTLRLHQIYYDAFKTTRNIRKIYKGILFQRSNQNVGISIIPRSNHMYVYSQRLIAMQLIPNEKLEALVEAANNTGRGSTKVPPSTKTLYSFNQESSKPYQSVPTLPDRVSSGSGVQSNTHKKKDIPLPPRSHHSDIKSASTCNLFHEVKEKTIIECRASTQLSRSSGASANSQRRGSSALTEDSVEMSSSKFLDGRTDAENPSSAADIQPVGTLPERSSSRYYTPEVKLAGRLVRFPSGPTTADMPFCSCNCHGGPRRTITSSVVQGLKLVEKSNFKLKFLYWNAMREHGAMEHLVVQRNYYEMLANCRKKGSTQHDLITQPNLNPYWAKVLRSRCLGKMSFLYIKYFRSLVLMLIAMVFVFFSVVLVLSELMSPIGALAPYSPLLVLYDYVADTSSASARLILVYAIFGLLVAYLQCALLNLRFFNIYRLVKHSTDIMSLLFIIARVPTYIFPLGWNLMLLLNIQFDTAYGTVMAQMSAIPIMGMDFSNYFPIVIIVLTVLFASNLDRIIWAAMGQDITPNMICLLRKSYKVEEGKEYLDQWVTGTFEYLDTEGNTPQKPLNCCTRCIRSIFAPANSGD